MSRTSCRQRGFTLIEMMLVVAIVGITASVVLMALPDVSPRQQGREALARLADTLPGQRREAMAQGRTFGLLIRPHGYQFMVQQSAGWQALAVAEMRLADEVALTLNQQDLLLEEVAPGEDDNSPQVRIYPGGEVTPFTLSAFIGKQLAATLSVNEAGETALLEPAP